MEIKEILNEFVKECSSKLDLGGIIQFGSSTYLKDFHDIDLFFISNNCVNSANEILILIKIIKNFENRFAQVTFDFSGLNRKRKTKYSITVVFLQKESLSTKHTTNDLFLFKNLSLDKNKKVLFGKDPFKKMEISLNDIQLFELLSVDVSKALRKCLDDEEYKNESIYFLFKTYLRAMLINEGHFKKNELLDRFKEKFGSGISLPKNSGKIINHKLKKEDFQGILKFCENCLNYLIKKK